MSDREEIRQRLLAESDLRKSHDELEDRIADRTLQLQEANEQLRRKIEEHRRVEEALQQSEEKYRGLVDACPDAVIMSDLNGQLLFASRQVCGLFALDHPDEMIGHHITEYVVERHRGQMAINLRFLVEKGMRVDAEYIVLRKDGSTIPLETSAALIRDAGGHPFAFVAVLRDITERKKNQMELQQSHAQLQAIYDGMVDGLHILDLQTMRVVRVNSALCRMMGCTENETYMLSQAEVHPPEQLPQIIKAFQTHLKEKTSFEPEVPLVRKDKSIFYADIVASHITYNDRPALMCIFHDATERRKAQEVLQQEQRTLKHMLQANDHERQLIAYDIHDGLAQNLAGAIMQFQAYEQFKDTHPDLAQKSHENGLALLRQGYSEARRLISGVRPPILDESGVVAAISHLIQDLAAGQGPEIKFYKRVQFHRLAPTIENAIYRIVQEGLNNAQKYSNSKKIVIRLMQQDRHLRILIRDWGVGFDPKQVHQKNRFGLSGIRERVRHLHGRFRMKSRPNEGTSILVELPVIKYQQET